MIMVRFLPKRANTEGIPPQEETLQDTVVGSDDRDARDVMIRRNDLTTLDGGITLKECVSSILHSTMDFFPVCEDNIDTILGILCMRDAVRQYILHPENAEKAISDIPGLIREAAIIPETRQLDSIFKYMCAQKIRMMIVVDEYGQTAGVVTMDDLIDEIAGMLYEDYERDDGFVLQTSGNSVVLDGMMPLERAGEVLHCDFGTEDFETLSGYLTSLLRHIPTSEDTSVAGNGFLFHILKTENHTIRKVRAERLPGEEGD